MTGSPVCISKIDTLKMKRYNQIALPRLAMTFLNDVKKPKNVYTPDSNYDLVYILKQSDVNPDLKFSLRSVEKFCTFRNIWVVGYKPNWVKNVNYLPTVQSGNKWVNSMTNIVAACNCPEISEDFVLMNDDFFMLRSITDWRKTFNLCLNTIDEEAKKYENKNPSRWQYGFLYAKELLDALHCEKRYNYEFHGPIVFNKQKFLEMLEIPEIAEITKTSKCFHKRSMYKNIYPDLDLPAPRHFSDTKLRLNYVLLNMFLHESFISVFDDVVDNDIKYPKINAFLYRMFPEKSKYEA